jgi:insertion element IS1 protein InsB
MNSGPLCVRKPIKAGCGSRSVGQHAKLSRLCLAIAVERFNNTLRQRLARFVRKTLSFSKSELMHLFCLRLFIWRYNMDIRARYLQAIDL